MLEINFYDTSNVDYTKFVSYLNDKPDHFEENHGLYRLDTNREYRKFNNNTIKLLESNGTKTGVEFLDEKIVEQFKNKSEFTRIKIDNYVYECTYENPLSIIDYITRYTDKSNELISAFQKCKEYLEIEFYNIRNVKTIDFLHLLKNIEKYEVIINKDTVMGISHKLNNAELSMDNKIVIYTQIIRKDYKYTNNINIVDVCEIVEK